MTFAGQTPKVAVMSQAPTVAGGLMGLLALAVCTLPGTYSGAQPWMSLRPEDRGEHQVTVRVLDAQRTPVPGATVAIEREHQGPTTRSTLRGVAVLIDLSAGRWTLVVRARGFERVIQEVTVPGEHDVLLQAGRSIGGVVVDDERRPLSDVHVSASVDEGERWVRRTDANGRFLIDTLPTEDVTLTFSLGGYATTVRPIERHRQLAPDWTVVLDRVAGFSGRVFEPDGKPAADATVVLAGSGIWPALTTGTNDQGRFVYDDLPPGVYEIRAHRGELTSQPVTGVDMQAAARRVLTLRLQPGLAITGRVVDDRTGRGIVGATVNVKADALGLFVRKTETDDRGAFEIAGLLEGSHAISVVAPGYVQLVDTRVDAGDTAVLRLSKTGAVTGRVVDAAGQPLEDAHVQVLRDEAGSRAFFGHDLGVTRGAVPPIQAAGQATLLADRRDGRSRADGRFDIEGLAPGKVRVAVSLSGYRSHLGEPFSLRSGQTLSLADITLTPGQDPPPPEPELSESTPDADTGQTLEGGAIVVGSVVDDWSDEPVVDATVSIGQRRGRTDTRGRFRITGVPLGANTLTTQHADHGSTSVEVTIELPRYADTFELSPIVLAPRGAIEGEVRDALGQPVPDAEVAWGEPPDWSAATRTRDDGTYTLRGVDVGLQTVTARHPQAGQTSRDRVSVRPKETAVDVYLRAPDTVDGEPK